jgi:hypothetical protein
MPYDEAAHNDEIMTTVQRHHLDMRQRLQEKIQSHPGVKEAVNKALAGGVPWASIITAILPFIMQILGGGAINWAAIIAAVLALINPPAPTPHVIPLYGTEHKTPR